MEHSQEARALAGCSCGSPAPSLASETWSWGLGLGHSTLWKAGLDIWARKQHYAHFQCLRKEDIVYYFVCVCMCIEQVAFLPRKHTLLPASPNRAGTDWSSGQRQEWTRGVLAPQSFSPVRDIHEHNYSHWFLFLPEAGKNPRCLNQLSTSSVEANKAVYCRLKSDLSPNG